jgi:rubrerythrin
MKLRNCVGLFLLVATAVPLSWAKQVPQKTLHNLNEAIQVEANAVNRYQLFATRALEEGATQVAKLFRAAAQAELTHEQNHRNTITDLGAKPEEIRLESVTVRNTKENLESQIQADYTKFIEEANREHIEQAANAFLYAQKTEMTHSILFKNALSQLGHNPAEDYYVSHLSGDTIAIPVGQRFSSKNGEYSVIR